jgi:hypothetical protein
MNVIFGIISGTPLWVWLLLALLVWQGMKATRPQTIAIWHALLLPVIFTIWGLSRIGINQQMTIGPLIAWAVCALALLPVGILTPRPLEIDRTTGRIFRQGSVFPLIRNIVVFALLYAAAVLAAMRADGLAIGAIISRAISGGTSGYFIGSAFALLREYRRTPSMTP